MMKMYGIICCSETSKYKKNFFFMKRNPYTGRTASIKERSLILRLNGLILNENPGSSNINEGKNPSGLKSKVSRSMMIIAGLVMSKLRPNWFKTKANLVNIPELYRTEKVLRTTFLNTAEKNIILILSFL